MNSATDQMYPSLTKALLAHRSLSPRAEEVRDYAELFVDPNLWDLVFNNIKQVIYGSRGSGKTTLLGALTRDRFIETQGKRVFTFYVSAQDLKVSPFIDNDLPYEKARAFAYFQNFIRKLVIDLSKDIDPVLEESANHVSLWLGIVKSKRSKIEDCMIRALDLMDEGEVFWYSTPKISAKETTNSNLTKDSKLGAKGNIDITGTGGAASLSASVARSKESVLKKDTEYVKTAEACISIRIASIRDQILEILELLNIDYLIICIDEWMTLDDSAGTELQSEFAELVKRLVLGTSKLTVKIASDRQYTRFMTIREDGHLRGLEVEADIFPAQNLDWAILTEQELVEFYESVIVKRLIRCNPELDKLFRDQHDAKRPFHAIIEYMFKDKDGLAFKELIRSAQGNTRNFIIYLNECIEKIRGDVKKNPISYKLVRDCVHARSFTGRLGQLTYDTLGEVFLVKCIKTCVQNSFTELFLVPRSVKSKSCQKAIEELLKKRLIHEYPESNLPSEVRENYRAYVLLYGAFLDWQRTFLLGDESTNNEKLMHYTIPLIKPGDNIKKYIVQPDSIKDAFSGYNNIDSH